MINWLMTLRRRRNQYSTRSDSILRATERKKEREAFSNLERISPMPMTHFSPPVEKSVRSVLRPFLFHDNPVAQILSIRNVPYTSRLLINPVVILKLSQKALVRTFRMPTRAQPTKELCWTRFSTISIRNQWLFQLEATEKVAK